MSTANDTRIAVVTGVSPYQVQIVGESVPLNIAPIVLADVAVGDYVWCQFFGQQLVVMGRIHDGTVPQLGSTEDLNDFVYTGTWNQPLNANTDLARNYPVTKAGVLEVTRSLSNGDMVQQRYRTYDSSAIYWRAYYQVTGWPTSWNVYGQNSNWTNLTLQNSWVAYGAPFYTPQFKVENGKTHVRGLVKSGTAVTIATLPVGARPTGQLGFTTTTSPNAYCRIDVHTDGTIQLIAGQYNASYVFLDGIHPFDAEQ